MFDLEVLVPVSSTFSERLEDFKRCGLANFGERKVLVTVLVSGESIDGLDRGWPSGIKVEVSHEPSPQYVANLYRHYIKMNPDSPRSRWFVRLDDDTCTDVNGLVSNLDSFYSWEQPYHLGELNNFYYAKAGTEGRAYEDYKSLLGKFEPISSFLKNEIECGITSAAGISKVLSNPESFALLERRSSLAGGFGDCVFAIAAAMAGVWPVECPFVTHLPSIQDFSLFGGLKNHIHKIARVPQGTNFGGRASYEGFALIMKAATNEPNEAESSLFGRRFLLEEEKSMKIIELKKGYIAKFKMDDRIYNWFEKDGEVVVLLGNEVLHRVPFRDGRLDSCLGLSVSEI
jgi:hypothetical protein